MILTTKRTYFTMQR